MLENVKHALIEKMADFLDSEVVRECELTDPEPRETSELHIRMAEAAYGEFIGILKSEAMLHKTLGLKVYSSPYIPEDCIIVPTKFCEG